MSITNYSYNGVFEYNFLGSEEYVFDKTHQHAYGGRVWHLEEVGK